MISVASRVSVSAIFSAIIQFFEFGVIIIVVYIKLNTKPYSELSQLYI